MSARAGHGSAGVPGGILSIVVRSASPFDLLDAARAPAEAGDHSSMITQCLARQHACSSWRNDGDRKLSARGARRFDDDRANIPLPRPSCGPPISRASMPPTSVAWAHLRRPWSTSIRDNVCQHGVPVELISACPYRPGDAKSIGWFLGAEP